jgi:hypothetical protein
MEIWFGTRGSEVQILSPRPIFSIRYSRLEISKKITVDRNVAAGSSADSTYHPLTGNYLIKEEPV